MRPYSRYKPSGIEWIGEIPENWEVRKLKFLGESIMGIIYSPYDVVDNSEEGTLVLRASNIQGGKFIQDDNVYVKSTYLLIMLIFLFETDD